QAHQSRVPQITVAVRHKTVLAKETRKKVHASRTPCAGNALIPSSPRPIFRQSNQWHRHQCVATAFISRPRLRLKKHAALISYGTLCESGSVLLSSSPCADCFF